jgi:hypothetical protein
MVHVLPLIPPKCQLNTLRGVFQGINYPYKQGAPVSSRFTKVCPELQLGARLLLLHSQRTSMHCLSMDLLSMPRGNSGVQVLQRILFGACSCFSLSGSMMLCKVGCGLSACSWRTGSITGCHRTELLSCDKTILCFAQSCG